jgi:hypothetical protein
MGHIRLWYADDDNILCEHTHTVLLQFWTDFFQRILPVLSNGHRWNWLLSWLNFMLGWPCITYNFALFRFQLDTLIILYIYNLGFLSISTCFGPIGPSSGDQMPLSHKQLLAPFPRSLSVLGGRSNTNGRPRQTTTEGTVPEAACAIKASDLLMMDRSVRNM